MKPTRSGYDTTTTRVRVKRGLYDKLNQLRTALGGISINQLVDLMLRDFSARTLHQHNCCEVGHICCSNEHSCSPDCPCCTTGHCIPSCPCYACCNSYYQCVCERYSCHCREGKCCGSEDCCCASCRCGCKPQPATAAATGVSLDDYVNCSCCCDSDPVQVFASETAELSLRVMSSCKCRFKGGIC